MQGISSDLAKAIADSSAHGAGASTDEILRHLEANAFCADLPRVDLEWFANHVTPLHLPTNAILFEDRDMADSIYLVARGAVSFLSRVTLSAEFTEIAKILPGDFFGEGAVIDKISSELVNSRNNQEDITTSFRNRNSRARVLCPVPSLLYSAPAKVVSQLLYRQPVLMARNLLKHSADKSRMSSQSLFDEVIKRETKLVVNGITDWITRHTIDFLTTLQINSDILLERAIGGPSQFFLFDMAETLANYRNIVTALRELAAGVPPRPPLQPLNLRTWLTNLEPSLKMLCSANQLQLVSYAEDLECVANPKTLDKAIHYCFLGLCEVAEKKSKVEIRVGKNQSLAEIHVTFDYPALSEFILLRLFEPFALRGENQDVGICMTLSRYLLQSLGGDAQVKRRSGKSLTLSFHFPLQPILHAT